MRTGARIGAAPPDPPQRASILAGMQLAISKRTQNGMRALRAQAAVFERYRGFDRCMRKLAVAEDQVLPFAAVAELFACWGDPLSQSDESYLRSCLAEAARAAGPIVQCGTSALTLVLGSLCSASAQHSKQLWCLEDNTHHANMTRSWLTQYQLGSAHVIASRAHLFDGYVWYAVDTERLAEGIALVLCEGARATPGGAVGALNRLGDRLAADCTILARRVTRSEDLKQLNAWARANQASFVIVDRREGFVKISRRSAAADPAAPAAN